MVEISHNIPHKEKGILEGPTRIARALAANIEYAWNYDLYLDRTRSSIERQLLDKQIPRTMEWYNPKKLGFIQTSIDQNLPPHYKTDHADTLGFSWKVMTEYMKNLSPEQLKQLGESSHFLSEIMKGSSDWNPEKTIIPQLVALAYLSSSKDTSLYDKDKKYYLAKLRKVKSDVKLTDIPSNSPRIEHLDTIAKHVAVVMQAYLKRGGLVSSPEQFASSIKEYDFRHPDIYDPIPPFIAVDLLIEDTPSNQKKLDEIIAKGVETINSGFNKSDYLADLALAPDREIADSEIPPDSALTARLLIDDWIESTLINFNGFRDEYFDNGIFNEKGMQLLCKSTLQRIGLTMENGAVGIRIPNPQTFTLRDINEILDQFSSRPNQDKTTPLLYRLTDAQRKSILEAIAVSVSIYSTDLASKKMYPDAERARAIAVLTMSHLKDIK